jgi:SAM-dependent methyltransferase
VRNAASSEPDSRHRAPPYAAGPAGIYREDYAERYQSLYLEPWLAKHLLDAKNLDAVLSGLGPGLPRWLDLACGQAWHFSAFPGRARMVGVDLSEAQLARARRVAPQAAFLRADMAEVAFPPGSFDLVTNFWAGYCYLASAARIIALIRSALDWVAPGGALYLEVLLGSDLASFNRSRFSARTGFQVSPLADDFSTWQYVDTGGRHVMASPPIEDFLEVVAPAFGSVDASHDGSFMTHLIARNRR